MFAHRNLVFLAITAILSACNLPSVDVNGSLTVTVPVTLPPSLGSSSGITCTAAIAPSAGNVISGQATLIDVSATGGVAPYSVSGTSTSFSSTTVISRTYTNSGSTSTVESDTVTVQDSTGATGQCSLLVTILPASSSGSNLTCTLAATPSTPSTSQAVTLLVTASGGSQPYTFSNFIAGGNAAVLQALAPVGGSSTQANTVIQYSAPGVDTAAVQVTDASGNEVACYKSLVIVSGPQVLVSASPATSVVAGNTITLNAFSNGFNPAPTFTYSTTQSEVSIGNEGSTATITSSVQQPYFNVTVTASNGVQTASTQVSLSFTAPATLTCLLSHTPGVYSVGNTVNYEVTNLTNPSDTLRITYFATNSDGAELSMTSSSRAISYSLAGTKTALAQAVSLATGESCGGPGATLSDSVQISAPAVPALTCTSFASINPASINQWVPVSAVINGGQGVDSVRTITVLEGGSNYGGYGLEWTGPTTAMLEFPLPGTYTLQLNIVDTYGGAGNCTTTVVVY